MGRWIRRLTVAVAAMACIGVATPAHARGKRAMVPDLRRDAAGWTAAATRMVVRLPVTVHIATANGDPIARQARVAKWLARANEEFAPFGVEVEVRGVRHLPNGWASVTSWFDRRRLAHYAPRDGTLHVFVVDQLDRRGDRYDKRRVRGLHWEYRGFDRRLRNREYIVVTRNAPMTTFAHEIGHFLGLRHSTRVDNIMCSCRRGEDVRFELDQGIALRNGARHFVRRGTYRGRSLADRRRRPR